MSEKEVAWRKVVDAFVGPSALNYLRANFDREWNADEEKQMTYYSPPVPLTAVKTVAETATWD